MRALLATLAVALALPAPAAAMTLMTEDSRVFGDMRGSLLAEVGYAVADRLGVEMLRYHRGLEPPNEALYHLRVSGWVDDTIRHGLEPYLAIVYQPDFYTRNPSPVRFGRWCGEIGATYGTRVQHFAVWNEPNNGKWGPFLMGQPREYNRLYRACYAALEAATGGSANVYYGEIDAHRPDPCAWVEQSLEGAGTTLTDGLAIHTYQWRVPPGEPNGTWCQGIGRLDDWNNAKRDWAERGRLRTPAGGEPPLLITEHGYCAPQGECPATPWGGGNAVRSERRRAQLVRDAFIAAQARGVAVFSYYHLFNQPDAAAPRWDSGILDAQTGLPSASACALRDLAHGRLVSLAPDLRSWETGPAGCG